MRIVLAATLLVATAGAAVAVGLDAFADAFAGTERLTHDVRAGVSRVVVQGSAGDVAGAAVARRPRHRARDPPLAVHGHAGPLELAADSGDVRADDVRGAIRMEADSGAVTGRALRSERGTGTADSGDVLVRGR